MKFIKHGSKGLQPYFEWELTTDKAQVGYSDGECEGVAPFCVAINVNKHKHNYPSEIPLGGEWLTKVPIQVI